MSDAAKNGDIGKVGKQFTTVKAAVDSVETMVDTINANHRTMNLDVERLSPMAAPSQQRHLGRGPAGGETQAAQPLVRPTTAARRTNGWRGPYTFEAGTRDTASAGIPGNRAADFHGYFMTAGVPGPPTMDCATHVDAQDHLRTTRCAEKRGDAMQRPHGAVVRPDFAHDQRPRGKVRPLDQPPTHMAALKQFNAAHDTLVRIT